MNYKKRQILGFSGLLAILLIVLAAASVFLYLNNKSVNVDMEARYGKVKAVSDLRSTFYTLDSELVHLVAEEDRSRVASRIEQIQQYRRQAMEHLLIAESFDGGDPGSARLAAIRVDYETYLDSAQTLAEEIGSGRSADAAAELSRITERNRADLVTNLDAFQSVQQQALEESRKRTGEITRITLWVIGIAIPVTILLSIFLMFWTIRGTTRSLKSVSDVMRGVDFNNAESLPRLHTDPHGEIGNIAFSFNEMAASLETHNRKARELNEELAEYNWIQTALAESSALYQNINTLDQLSYTFLRKVVPLTGSAYGVFYLRTENDDLKRISSFAGYPSGEPHESFKIGEGLVGRAAESGEILSIAHVPEHYLRIASGTGQAAPASLLIVPIQFENRIKAVVEFASLEPFSPAQKHLVEQLTNTLGIALNSVAGRMEVDRLLRESQMLTEELQTQAEELQSQSEEMQAQSEELRSQQDTLRGANEQLERTNLQVEEKNRLLEVVQSELVRNSEFQSEFLANMSHELRTPLNSILILSQILSEKEDHSLSGQEKEYASTIYRSGKDLLALIDDILDLAKAEAGQMDVLIEPYNVTELPHSMLGLFSEIAKRKNLVLEASLEPDTPELIWTDGRRVEQIVKNLLSNAIKFTPQGSVKLKIGTVDSETGPGSRELKIEVSDTGIGIKDDKRSLIFEAFRQADSTTERVYGGTGLGLSICREFSRLLKGRIDVESADGKGSTFTVILPLDLRDSQTDEADLMFKPAPVPSRAAIAPGVSKLAMPADREGDLELFRNRKLLLVDDDARNIYAISIALENKGAEVGIAENGREALEVLERDPSYDLILMDIMMPEMNGYEAMQQIRSKPEFSSVPIIVLSAKAMKEEREMCLAAGASDYISKPLDVEKLFSMMRVWLSK
ncbi:ATP-binding protein [Saccharibacillus qingshengii]|uniref:ATP-binding protein n=1 Tax=Saccharibacillus qingshengii TaxID=1763540 RepID=UPI0015535FC0|nr:ATP-binding protein [Saccharibacillus qingshengii]